MGGRLNVSNLNWGIFKGRQEEKLVIQYVHDVLFNVVYFNSLGIDKTLCPSNKNKNLVPCKFIGFNIPQINIYRLYCATKKFINSTYIVLLKLATVIAEKGKVLIYCLK